MLSKTKKAVIAVLVLFAALICYFGANALAIWRYASVDETQKADAAIVLGAAADETGPSPVFKGRLDHAILLYESALVGHIVVTGGVGDKNVRSDAAIGAEYLVAAGVPRDAIILEESSTITEENLKNAASLVAERGFGEVLIVSDPLHMKRAMLLAADAGLTAHPSPTQTSMYQSLPKKLGFLARETFYYVGYKWVRIFR